MGGEEVKHLSLFTGIGGIDLAAEWAGFESVCMVERDKYCQKVLAKNFEGVKIHDDVTTFNGLEYRGTIDLVSAGFPCQPHSLAGLRKASGDERDLWGEVVRILRETEPAWFLGENVPGLFTSERGQFFGRIINDLESLGYSVGWGCYGAKDVGAVHKRDRVFIVAYAKGKHFNGNKPDIRELEESSTSKPRSSDCQTDVAYASGKSRLQTNTTIISKRGERDSWDNVNRSYWKRDATNSNGTRCEEQWGNISNESEHNPIKHGAYKSIKTGDWRQWGISPTVRLESRVCGDNDGVSYRVDKHRTQRLKALGNAVVPQQVFPILQEIARQIRENGGATP
jgi:DNA (cytosine-5)-methyltransferase 1